MCLRATHDMFLSEQKNAFNYKQSLKQSFIPVEHLPAARQDLWVEMNITEKAAFHRNALCWFEPLRLAQNVPTERRNSCIIKLPIICYYRNKKMLPILAFLKYVFVPAELIVGRIAH